MKKYSVKTIENNASYARLTLVPRSQRDILQFEPGQYAAIGFKVDGRPSPMRCFSMVSSPDNSRELEFAFRVQGNFTRTLSRLNVGDEVSLQGPYGNFILSPNDRHPILIAGGIGITPFVSMLRAAAENGSQTPLTLLYGCRTQGDIPFYNEITQLQAANPHFNVIFFVNDGPITPVEGVTTVTGRIDARRLQQLTGGRYDQFSYFICGPDGFRDGLETILQSNGVSSLQILTESFSQINKIEAAFGVSMPTFTYVLASIAMVALIGFIMTLDLKQSVTKATVTSTSTTPAATTATQDTTSSATTSQPADSTQTTTPVATDTTTSPATTSPTTTVRTPTYTNTYRQPTSSVS